MIEIIIMLGILYIIEIEPLFHIIYFILIVISVSWILYREGVVYVSLILVIVYATALIILFGFILMKGERLFPWTTNIITWFYERDNYSIYRLGKTIFFLCFFLYLLLSKFSDTSIISQEENMWIGCGDKIRRIGEVLYSSPFLLLLSALLLFFPILSLLYLTQ